jgi:hypothetical protein
MDAQAADFGRASRITSRAGGPEPISIGRPGSSAQLVGWREHPRSSPKYEPDRWNRTATWDSHQPRWYLGESQLVPSVTRGVGTAGDRLPSRPTGSAGGSEKPDRAEVVRGYPQPASDRDRTARQSSIERRAVAIDRITRGRCVRQDDDARDCSGSPATFFRRSSAAIRTLRSSVPRRPWRSTTRVFTSTTTSADLSGCHASTSTEPRSPYRLNDHSTMTVQPRSRSSPTTISTIAA